MTIAWVEQPAAHSTWLYWHHRARPQFTAQEYSSSTRAPRGSVNSGEILVLYSWDPAWPWPMWHMSTSSGLSYPGMDNFFKEPLNTSTLQRRPVVPSDKTDNGQNKGAISMTDTYHSTLLLAYLLSAMNFHLKVTKAKPNQLKISHRGWGFSVFQVKPTRLSFSSWLDRQLAFLHITLNRRP